MISWSKSPAKQNCEYVGTAHWSLSSNSCVAKNLRAVRSNPTIDAFRSPDARQQSRETSHNHIWPKLVQSPACQGRCTDCRAAAAPEYRSSDRVTYNSLLICRYQTPTENEDHCTVLFNDKHDDRLNLCRPGSHLQNREAGLAAAHPRAITEYLRQCHWPVALRGYPLLEVKIKSRQEAMRRSSKVGDGGENTRVLVFVSRASVS